MATLVFLLSLRVLLLEPTFVRAQELQWPYNLPPHMKYFPEDEALVRRDVEISRRMAEQQPVYVKKMSGDPNEKFFLDFWCFAEDKGLLTEWANLTTLHEFGASLPLHSDALAVGTHDTARRSALGLRHTLNQRDFGCPADTTSCASINRPKTCCPNGSTCQIVPDNGLGDVGCCAAAQTCAGSLSQCPEGYASCPNNPGGGCCLPGYACYDEGCVMTSTTVLIVSPTTTSTTTTRTTTVSPSTTTTPTSTALLCSSGFRSCPAALGGGCCPTDRACGSSSCPEITTSASLTAPIRPTTSPTTSSSASISGCPTGFYACSAYHQGGCCQVGRNCASTSCPATASQTVVDTNGITAVAPSGTYLSGASSTPVGVCANGWSSCAATVGGGCCPTGYACGTAACSATASGGGDSQIGKQAPRSMAPSSSCSTTLGFTLLVMMWTIVMSS